MAKAKNRGSVDDIIISKDEQLYEIPSNWSWVKLGGIAAVKGGKRVPKGKKLSDDKTEHPYIRVTDMSNGTIDLADIKYVDDDIFSVIHNYTISSKDVYISVAGSIGKIGIIPECLEGANLTENAAKITNIVGTDNKYIMMYLQSDIAQIQMMESTISTTQPKLALFRIENINVPLPPLAEQKRIVEQIENLFSKLDEAKDKAQAVLDGFEDRKSAILFKAYSGELTKKWRINNSIADESWLKVVIKDVCKVNPPKINAKEYDDDLEVSFFPMPSLSEITGTITEPQTRKLGEVKSGFTNFIEGDVVFAKITPCMENGKSAIIPKLVNGIGYGTTEFFVLRCSEKLLNGYLYHLVRSKHFRDEAKAVMTGAVGQQRVPKSFIEDYEIGLPLIEEQKEILRLVDEMIQKERTVADNCEKVIEQIEMMKKSILARAFRGELGTNNSDEESAVELLKQILESN